MSLAEKMQYYTLKQQLKSCHDKEVHDLEFKYASIIVQLMREKKKVHQQMLDRYCHQMDQLNQSLFAAVTREHTKKQMQNYSNFDTHQNENHNKIKLERVLEIPLLKMPNTVDQNTKEKPKSPIKSGSCPTTENEKNSVPQSCSFIFSSNGIKQESENVSFDQVRQSLNSRKSEGQINAMDVLLKAIDFMERKQQCANEESNSDSDDEENSDSEDAMFDDALNVKTEVVDVDKQWVKKDNGFACKICKKVLRRAYDIKRHIQCVHNNERPHKCKECGAKFKLAFHLKEHQLTHLAVRPFKCYFCEKRFTRKRDITKHCKRMHAKEYEHYGAAKEYSASDNSSELSAAIIE